MKRCDFCNTIHFKPHILYLKQKVYYILWKYLEFRKVKVYSGYEIFYKKKSCPLVYYTDCIGRKMAIDFYFMDAREYFLSFYHMRIPDYKLPPKED